MADIPANLKYTKDHEWVSVDGDVATIGITDFAQKSVGDIVFIDFPGEGDDFSTGDSYGAIESVKAAEDYYAPLDGQIVAVNADVQSNWAVVNQEPYGGGWLLKIKLSDASQVDSLLDASAYQEIVDSLA